MASETRNECAHPAGLAEILSRFDPSVLQHYERCSTKNWITDRREESSPVNFDGKTHFQVQNQELEFAKSHKSLKAEPRRKIKRCRALKKCKFARKVAKKLLCMKKSSCKSKRALRKFKCFHTSAQIQKGSNTAASNSRPSSISTSLDQLFHQIHKSPFSTSDQPNSMEGSMNSITISVAGN
jgi:hypothetical protein